MIFARTAYSRYDAYHDGKYSCHRHISVGVEVLGDGSAHGKTLTANQVVSFSCTSRQTLCTRILAPIQTGVVQRMTLSHGRSGDLRPIKCNTGKNASRIDGYAKNNAALPGVLHFDEIGECSSAHTYSGCGSPSHSYTPDLFRCTGYPWIIADQAAPRRLSRQQVPFVTENRENSAKQQGSIPEVDIEGNELLPAKKSEKRPCIRQSQRLQ